MKSEIKLSLRHKDLFKEMCEHFFKIGNINYISWALSDKIRFCENATFYANNGALRNYDRSFMIHWFEFAIKRLIPVLDIKKGDVHHDWAEMIAYICNNQGEEDKLHPVDYLYAIFSQVK